jgi:single-stranded-DNA-specific exonuclease
MDNEQGQGSGRSVPHFPLHEVLEACAPHLQSFGGHAMAAGVKLKKAQVEPFTRAFLAEAAQRLTQKDLAPTLHLDDEVSLGELTPDAIAALHRLAPFGTGNPRVRLATKAVELVGTPQTVGASGAHLSFTVRDGREHRRAIAFGKGADAARLGEQRHVRVAFEPTINEWNGTRRVELQVVDWQPVDGMANGA